MVFKDEFRTMDDIFRTLATFDYYCFKENIEAELLILGGSALLTVIEMKNGSFRSTRDIDVDIIRTNDTEALMKLIRQFNIDIVGGVMEVPPKEDFVEPSNYKKLNLDFKAIKVFLPSIELLACTKLFTKRRKDLEDLKKTDILERCNKEKLLEMVDEYQMNLLNPSDPFLNYHELDRLFKEKGI